MKKKTELDLYNKVRNEKTQINQKFEKVKLLREVLGEVELKTEVPGGASEFMEEFGHGDTYTIKLFVDHIPDELQDIMLDDSVVECEVTRIKRSTREEISWAGFCVRLDLRL